MEKERCRMLERAGLCMRGRPCVAWPGWCGSRCSACEHGCVCSRHVHRGCRLGFHACQAGLVGDVLRPPLHSPVAHAGRLSTALITSSPHPSTYPSLTLQVYMAYIQATEGGGGWPMSCFLTPSLDPFFGGARWRGGQHALRQPIALVGGVAVLLCLERASCQCRARLAGRQAGRQRNQTACVLAQPTCERGPRIGTAPPPRCRHLLPACRLLRPPRLQVGAAQDCRGDACLPGSLQGEHLAAANVAAR